MIPTKKIKLDGKEYPFHFGTGAVYLLGLELDLKDVKLMDIEQVMQEMALGKIPLVMWVGFLSGASKTGRDVEKVLSVSEIEEKLKKDPYALDQAMTIVYEIQEEYSEGMEGNPPKAKGKK